MNNRHFPKHGLIVDSQKNQLEKQNTVSLQGQVKLGYR